MNAPAHAVVNLCLLAPGGPGGRVWPVVLGAVLPDLPGYTFWAAHRLSGLTDPVIWGELYPQPLWQDLLGPFHSLPLALALLGLGALLRRRFVILLAASWLLHVLMDVPLHHTDAPRFLFPLSDLRFRSPVSYWDRAFHAGLVAPLELAVLLAGSLVLGLRTRSLPGRAALGAACAAMLALYASGWLFWNSVSPGEATASASAVPPPFELRLKPLPPADGGARPEEPEGLGRPGRDRVPSLR